MTFVSKRANRQRLFDEGKLGLAVGALGELAHREHGDFIGVIEQGGGGLELRAHRGEALADGCGELVEGGWHVAKVDA